MPPDAFFPEYQYQMGYVEIYTPEELAAFAYLTMLSAPFYGYPDCQIFATCNAVIMNDIDLSDYIWDLSIGYYDNNGYDDSLNAPFSGTFDGQGCTITGLASEYYTNLYEETGYVPILFDYILCGKVMNANFSREDYYTAGTIQIPYMLANQASYSIFENIYACGNGAGFINGCSYCYLNTVVYYDYSEARDFGGGIVNSFSGVMEYCEYTHVGDLLWSPSYDGAFFGGLAGYAQACVIKDCNVVYVGSVFLDGWMGDYYDFSTSFAQSSFGGALGWFRFLNYTDPVISPFMDDLNMMSAVYLNAGELYSYFDTLALGGMQYGRNNWDASAIMNLSIRNEGLGYLWYDEGHESGTFSDHYDIERGCNIVFGAVIGSIADDITGMSSAEREEFYNFISGAAYGMNYFNGSIDNFEDFNSYKIGIAAKDNLSWFNFDNSGFNNIIPGDLIDIRLREIFLGVSIEPEPIYFTITYMPNGGTPNSNKSQLVEYGQNFTTLSSSTFTRAGYTLSGWQTVSGGSFPKCNTQYNYDYNGDTTLRAIWTASADYILYLDGLLDGVESDSISPYATCDLYINGTRVSSGISNCSYAVGYGSTYEFRNIQLKTDKAYVGLASDSDPIAGTIKGNATVILSFRTKTWNDYAASSYDSGSGTPENPYLIKTAEQFAKLSADSQASTLNGTYFKLAADIDLSGHIWSGIGVHDVSMVSFEGVLDGDFYVISNIKTSVDYFVKSYMGLIANSNAATISNIIMQGGEVVGGQYVGAIGGSLSNTTVLNCIVDSVNVSAVQEGNSSTGLIGGEAGGITGQMSGLIANCIYMNGETNADVAGGLVGDARSLTIQYCSVINSVINGGTYSGLMYGLDMYSGTSIFFSYGFGEINGATQKLIYGSDTMEWWTYWEYVPNINGDYPVQRALFHISNGFGSTGVYGYLKNTLGFTEV